MKNFSMAAIENELIVITQQLLRESGEEHTREITLDASLQRHLGIDSLSRSELFRRIEKKFAMSLPDKLLAEAESLRDIARYIHDMEPTLTLDVPLAEKITHNERSQLDPSNVQSLLDLLLLYGEQAPHKPHIYFQREDGKEEVITYGALLTNSLRIAHSLRLHGLKEGDTVAIMQPTNPGFFYTFFGTLFAGGIPVPIYPPFRAHMIEAYTQTEARILRSAEVRILVTFDKAEILSRLLQGFVPSLQHVVTVDDLLHTEILSSPFHATAQHFALIQYTSGSTSDPKGVLLTHHNLLSNIRAYGKAIAVTADDVAVSWLPLYHDMGLIGMWLGSLYHGIPLVLLNPFTFLNRPEKWLWAIHRHRGTLSGAPNFAYELCIRKIEPQMLEGLDLSSWRMAANGAEKIYPRTLKQFADKFAPYGFRRNTLLPVYGLAESTVALAISTIGHGFRIDHIDRKQFEERNHASPTAAKNGLDFVGCGKVIENHEIRIVNEEGNVLAERMVGRLQFRGPSSMQGYYNNSRATAAVYHDGWIDTGDLAYQADGDIFITGRGKDLIIKAGRNIYPAEIEELAGKIPGVREGCVAAFGVMDAERGTEQLVVVAETHEKNKAKRREIILAINDAIATTLDIAPDHVVLVAPRTVPKTSSGKLQRAACKTLYSSGHLSRIKIPAWAQVLKLGIESFAQRLWRVLGSVGKIIYTLYCCLLLLLTILPLWLIVKCSTTHHTAARACRFGARLILRASFCPLSQQTPPLTSPVIFACNHASYIDALVVLAIMPIDTRFVVKKELFTMPLVRTFARKLHCLAIDRGDLPKGLEDTKHIVSTLHAKHSILIFPEGTFGYASGLRPFRLGTFKIAAETQIPVCPVALHGTRTILRGNEKLLRPNKITVTFSALIHAQGTEWQDVILLRDQVRAEIARHCGESSLDFIVAETIAPKPPRG